MTTNSTIDSTSTSRTCSITDPSNLSVPSIRPLVVCGPSGVGKGTLLGRLLSEYPTLFGKSVSHTTRSPRAGEINGVSYHFVSKSDMEKDIAAGLFIEFAYVHTNIYGTSISSVEQVSKDGKVCILEVDVQGAEAIEKTTLKPYYFFIEPPSFNSLKERLIGRGTETDSSIAVRLDTAKKELDFLSRRADLFDVRLVNDDLEECYKQLKSELSKRYNHIKQIQ